MVHSIQINLVQFSSLVLSSYSTVWHITETHFIALVRSDPSFQHWMVYWMVCSIQFTLIHCTQLVLSSYSTIWHIAETYLIACLVNLFSTLPDFVELRNGVRKSDLFMSWESIFSDVRNAVDWVHMKVIIEISADSCSMSVISKTG